MSLNTKMDNNKKTPQQWNEAFKALKKKRDLDNATKKFIADLLSDFADAHSLSTHYSYVVASYKENPLVAFFETYKKELENINHRFSSIEDKLEDTNDRLRRKIKEEEDDDDPFGI